MKHGIPPNRKTGRKEKRLEISVWLLTAALIAGFYCLWRLQTHREQSFQSNRISYEAERVKLEIEETLKQTSLALSRFSARAEYLGIEDQKYLDLDSRMYLEQLPILKRIGITNAQNKVIWSYPHEIASQVLNYDQSEDRIRLEAFAAASKSHQPSFSRSVELKSGGTGFILPIPLYKKQNLIGFAYATIEAEKLFHSFVPKSDFEVQIIENGRSIFKSHTETSTLPSLTKRLELRWGKSVWSIEITPTKSFLAKEDSGTPDLILIFGIAGSLLLGAYLHGTFRSRREALLNSERLDLQNLRLGVALDAAKMGAWSLNLRTGEVWRSDNHDQIFGHAQNLEVWNESTFYERLLPEDKDYVKSEQAKSAQNHTTSQLEFRIRRFDDQSLRWIGAVTQTSTDGRGTPTQMIGTVRDITAEKKEAMDRLSSHELRNAILNSTNYSIISTDAAGVIQTFNSGSSKIFGYDPIEVIGKETPKLFHVPEEVLARAEALSKELGRKVEPGLDAFTAKARALNKPDESEWTFVRKDGSRFPVSLSISVLYDNSGNISGYLGISKDLTEKKKDQEQLRNALVTAEESTRTKSAFLANISHEIRTPINGVIGVTGLLLDLELSDQQRTYAEIIRSSAEILLSLINDLLDFSKIEAGKLNLECIDFDIDEVTHNIEQLLGVLAHKKGLRLTRTISSDLPTTVFKGDPTRIGQILANLLSNAIKFTEEGEIEIRISHSEAKSNERVQLKVEVTDTGIGMSSEALLRIFQPFSQADVSTTRRFGGTGLGLSICKHLVEMMGGMIGVRSKEGEGSTFWFTMDLPQGEKGVGQAPESHPPLPLALATKNLRVLLAEDNAVNQIITSKVLEKNGFHVDIVANGNQAIASLNSFPYDLVLMDCQMPELDGYEATKNIRKSANPAVANVPIIAMTANVMDSDREKCLAAGMTDYVTKPFKPEHLMAVIAKNLEILSKVA